MLASMSEIDPRAETPLLNGSDLGPCTRAEPRQHSQAFSPLHRQSDFHAAS